MTFYDLHSHSTASDGTLTPTLLVQQAAAAGVRYLALTDHDTLSGLAEAEQAAASTAMQLVPGVEISVTWCGRTIHIVGLHVDASNLALQRGLAELREFREWRAGEIANRLLKQAGIVEALAGARQYAQGALVSRTHFARYLVDCGVAASVQEVFKRYLVQGKPGHVPGQWASLEAVVRWIVEAGGVAVLAHPARYKMTATKLRALMGEFREAGGVALEVVSGSHSADDVKTMARNATQMGLLASVGSDYHGPENAWIVLGRLRALPEECVPVWHDWHERGYIQEAG